MAVLWYNGFMRKILFLVVVIVLIAGVVGSSLVYQRYARRRAARIEAQQQKPEELKITLVEGWTVTQIAKYLEAKELFPSSTFLTAQKKFDTAPYPFLASKPKGQDLEGFLFPDTYQVLKQTTPEAVLAKLLNTFELRFAAAAKNSSVEGGLYQLAEYPDLVVGKGSETGLSLYQIVTLASIIEKETGRDVSKATKDQQARLDEERKTVAGIFYNRLLLGQALQSDATVNYVTGKDTPAASADDIEINSPYNTYKYPGLPPGPICNPSRSSLEAALNPIKTEYYYFLHKQPSGEVVYSKTFEEHRQNKIKFLQ